MFFISSGRSAGVVGAARLGRVAGEDDIVVFDMGGTTASASLVQGGEISRANEYEFRAGISTPARFIKAGGYMMRVPTVDVAEVGSGGGVPQELSAAPPIDDIGVGVDLCGNVGAPRLQCGSIG